MSTNPNAIPGGNSLRPGGNSLRPDEETTIHTILQCFVDVNLNTNEDSIYSSNLLSVSFDKRVYNFDEGTSVDVTISLSAPSIGGYEEVEIGIAPNNTSLSDFSTLGELYPQSISFSVGQQSKTFSFFANTDLFEEGLESFDLILGLFSNTVPGQYITTTVNIIDTTNLKEVFFNDNRERTSIDSGLIPPVITLEALEGFSKIVRVSLDSPSILGIESVEVQLTNITTDSLDYSAFPTYTLSWAPGEQHKDIEIDTILDDLIETIEELQLSLVAPVNVNITNPQQVILSIIDDSPEFLYATINLQSTYVQWGGVSTPTVELRWIKENVTASASQPSQNKKRFLKFGHPVSYSDAETNFKSPAGESTNASAFEAGDNAIYNVNGFFDPPVVIFFGEKPEIDFNFDEWSVTTAPKTYGDLRLRIKNVGSHPSLIDGNTMGVGDFITVPIDRLDYKITLPTNYGLLSAGTLYNGTQLAEDTLTQCLYEFVFEVDFAEIGFQLRNENNSVSSNKEINIGTHLFTEVYTISDSLIPANLHNFTTEYNNIWPFWETDYEFPNQGPFCMPEGTQAMPNDQGVNYPLSIADLQNVFMDGIAFLHQDISTENSASQTKTAYRSFFFLPSGQTASSSGCTSVAIEYEYAFTNPPYTASVPFFVLGQ